MQRIEDIEISYSVQFELLGSSKTQYNKYNTPTCTSNTLTLIVHHTERR